MLLVHSSLVPPEDLRDAEDPRMDLYETEYDVKNALLALGHEVRVVGVYDEIAPIRQTIEEWQPHIAFNLLEEFAGRGELDYYIVSYLEMMRVPYTGCNPRGLVLARDKGISKKLLRYHHIHVPDFEVFPRAKPYRRIRRLRYPMVVKSLIEEGSIGIAQASYVENEQQLRDRVALIHELTQNDAIAEQYIDGRELYAMVMGNTRYDVLPVRELTFDQFAPGMPRMATYKVKWDMKYRERWGINFQFARPLPDGARERIVGVCKRVCRILDLNGYARMDLRMDTEGTIFVLEANPNPGIARYEDGPAAAEKAGMSYERFVQRILSLGLRASARAVA